MNAAQLKKFAAEQARWDAKWRAVGVKSSQATSSKATTPSKKVPSPTAIANDPLVKKIAAAVKELAKDAEQKKIDALLATRADLPKETLAFLRKQPLAAVRDAVKALPREPAQSPEKHAMDARMGLATGAQARNQGSKLVLSAAETKAGK